ncbi:unnamed protein product [marine sediment metagenome]|uniref:RNA polymerase sigma-70 region 2 domain-containing protein n=1 Tax=marine sediment metagenome TaxID=412755 RepID=X1R3Q4_9ZZZZ
MTIARQVRKPTKDFTKFYNEWQPSVTAAVYQSGFKGFEAEDLVQDIFADLYAGGYLDKYDKDRAAFSTYIWGHVKVRISGRKRVLWKHNQREFVPKPLITNEGEEITFEAPDPSDPFAETSLSITVDAISKELEALPATKSKNLARLFKDIVKMVQTEGEFSQTRLAQKYGISRQAVSYQIADLAKTNVLAKFREALK